MIVRLIPVPPVTIPKFKLLAPGRNGVRKESEDSTATPDYNQAVLEDAYWPANLRLLHACMERDENFSDAVSLLHAWHQRRATIFPSIGPWQLALLALALVNSETVGTQRPGRQIFQDMLKHLGDGHVGVLDPDARISPTLCSKTDVAGFSVDEFRKYFPAVFLGVHGRLNLVRKATREEVKILLSEAKRSADALSTQAVIRDVWDITMQQPVKFFSLFDCFVKLEGTIENPKNTHPGVLRFDRAIPDLVKILDEAVLGDKCDGFLIYRENPALTARDSCWETGEAPKHQSEKFVIGLHLNERSTKRIYTGPPGNAKELVEEFKEF